MIWNTISDNISTKRAQGVNCISQLRAPGGVVRACTVIDDYHGHHDDHRIQYFACQETIVCNDPGAQGTILGVCEERFSKFPFRKR